MARNSAASKPGVVRSREHRASDVPRSAGDGARLGGSTTGKRINWPAAKIEYVTNASLALADIAVKYGAKLGAVKAQALRKNWVEERAERSRILLQKVAEKATRAGIDELAAYNEQDILAAKSLRDLASKRMQQAQNGKPTAQDLRCLAATVESAQRIARLALGASTENTDTRITEIDRMTPDERRERIRQLHAEIFPTVQ
jgi:homoaconitase/3-isopropylmalate dehydratase large subunit